MKRLPILTAWAACLLLFASCNNKTSDLAIPKDAALVFHIHTSSLASKLSWEEIKNTGWFKDSYQKTKDDYAQKLMDDPFASGIDVRKDFAFFLQRRGKGGYNFFEGSIKDAAAFEALCKKMSKVEKVETDGEWQLLSPDEHSLVAWNKSRFAVINDMPLGSFNPISNRDGQVTRFTTDSLKVFLKEVMKGDNNLFDDDRFSSLVKEEGDMHLWVNSGSLYSDVSGMLAMMKVGSLFNGNVSASTINFDAGKISMNVKNYVGKEMQQMMKNWSAKTVDASVLNRLPSNDVIGVMAANIDPKGLEEFFKAAGFDGLINMALAKQDLTLAELLSATKGEFVLSFSDLTMQKQTAMLPSGSDSATFTYSPQRPDFNVLFATNVNQKSTFDKLLNTFSQEGAVLPFAYKLDDNWFVAGNKTEPVDGFLANKEVKKPFAEKISGHPFGLYIDFQRLLKTNFTEQSTGKSMLAESAAMWKELVATGGEYKDGASTAEVVVNLVDTKTNSLKQLNQYLEKMFQTSKKNSVALDNKENDVIIDTVTAAPPVETNPQ